LNANAVVKNHIESCGIAVTNNVNIF